MKTLRSLLLLCLVCCAPLCAQTSAVSLMPSPKVQLFDANGYPLAGGLVYTCVPGSSCPGTTQASYTDSTATVQNPNPVVLDAGGFANIWLLPQNYKIVVETAAGVVVSSVDNVSAIPSAFLGNNPTLARQRMGTYWGGPTFSTLVGNTYTTGPAGVPQAGFTSWVQPQGVGDAVSLLGSCELGVNNGVCFGENIVLGDKAGTYSNPTLVGMEIDLEGYNAPTSNSYGLSLVEYNVHNPSPAVVVRNGNGTVSPNAWAYGFYSDTAAAPIALQAQPQTFGSNTASQTVNFASVDSGGVARNGSLGLDAAGKLLLNASGISGSSTAIQRATLSSCATSAVQWSTCTTVVSWPTAFADTNYIAACSVEQAQNSPMIVNESNKQAGSITVAIAAFTGAAAAGYLDCIAIHQ